MKANPRSEPNRPMSIYAVATELNAADSLESAIETYRRAPCVENMKGLARFAGSNKRETKRLAREHGRSAKATPLGAAVLARQLHTELRQSALDRLTRYVARLPPPPSAEGAAEYTLW